jgi:hypothetical protein
MRVDDDAFADLEATILQLDLATRGREIEHPHRFRTATRSLAAHALLRQLAIALAKGLLGHASLVVRVTRTYSQVLVYTL